MTPREHNVECGTSIAPRIHKKIAESIDTDSADSIILLPRPEKNAQILLMPSTEIILTDNVPGLGAEADIVKVRRGYARNYLLPRGKAHEVTPASLRQVENLKKKRAEREARELNEAGSWRDGSINCE